MQTLGIPPFFVTVPIFVKTQSDVDAIGICYARKTNTNILSYVGRDVIQVIINEANSSG